MKKTLKNKKATRSRQAGFSLIEVNMAVLVVGLGILVLFGLFPAGLREGENGIVDTHCALFAETVLEGLRGEAHNKPELLDWNNWSSINHFIGHFTVDAGSGTVSGTSDQIPDGTTVSTAIEFPLGAVPKTYIRYIMEISEGRTPLTKSVNIWIWSGRYSSDDDEKFKRQSEWFATKYIYGKGI